jgi:hypothetical protein
MTPHKILQPHESYTFRSYFEMAYEIDQILAEFDYQFQVTRLTLPTTQRPFPTLTQLQQDLEDSLKLTRLSSEAARREVLISPILLSVARWFHCQFRVEYPIQVNQFLRGNLDYLLINQANLLVVEAKRDDLVRGFHQLAVELIALAMDRDLDHVYGAVTMGDTWRFGYLDQTQKIITQDIALYKIPDELNRLIPILGGILEGATVEIDIT